MKLVPPADSRTYRLLMLLFLLALSAPVALAQEKNEKKEEAKEEKKEEGLPLKPTRTIAFTTGEGTWLSLDVAPDGQRLVFELLGALSTLPPPGGPAPPPPPR